MAVDEKLSRDTLIGMIKKLKHENRQLEELLFDKGRELEEAIKLGAELARR